MSDTTTFNKLILIDRVSLDSLYQKVSTMQNTLAENHTNNSTSIWIPILSSIIGGALVLIGQYLERHNRKNSDSKNKQLEIYAYCRKLEADMKNHYRELAMAKAHVEYWWYCCNSRTSSRSDSYKYYEEHLKSQSYAREIERSIGKTKAEFIGHVRKFQVITPVDNNIEKQLNIISDLTNAKAKSYDFDIPYEKVRHQLYGKDEKELREKYYTNLEAFKTTNDILQSQISRK